MAKTTNTVAIGTARIDIHTGVVGWTVAEARYTDEQDARNLLGIGQVRIEARDLGWVIALGNRPVISLNEADLVTLGVALIKAGAR